MGFNGDLYPDTATSVMTTKGDMVDYDTERQRLGIGSANQILQVKSSLPSWETVPLADTVLTTAGDILYENATPELARLASGTQYNTLQMGATLPAWSASATSVLTTTGDLLYASGANTLARLASGTSGDVLTANGAGVAPSYQTPAGGGLWKLQGSLTITSSNDETITLTDQVDDASFVYCRYLGVGVAGQGADMQVGDNTSLETGSVYDSIGANMLASGSTTDFYTLNQVRFSFLMADLTSTDPFWAEAYLTITSDGRYQHFTRLSSAIGYGYHGGECSCTKSNLNQIRLFGDTMTGVLQVWSCSPS